MFDLIKQYISLNLKNIPGWRTRKRIVVIECDDWGSIRMPSRHVYNILINKGLNVATGWFNEIDTLESKTDIERLCDTLDMVRDKNGRSGIITAITNPANPDFERIKSSGFTEYYYEPFSFTLRRYYPDVDVLKVLKEAIQAGFLSPELHGRDHLAVHFWMEKLREGNTDLLIAFDHRFTCLDISDVPAPAKEFRAEFYFTHEGQKPFLKKAISDGVYLFKEIFGFMPRVFVPGNGIFHPDFSKVLAENGIKFQCVHHNSPYPGDDGKLKNRYYFSGQHSSQGIVYYIRNCAFEPADPNYIGIYNTMKQIEAAFRWGKPAIISTHRVNFVGSISKENRDHGLRELKILLEAIVIKWPDAEFMSSAEALELMVSTS
jgi:hypothetical protein